MFNNLSITFPPIVCLLLLSKMELASLLKSMDIASKEVYKNFCLDAHKAISFSLKSASFAYKRIR